MAKQWLLVVALLLLKTFTAFGDWVPEDGHKMHFPQLPDPEGWDIEMFSHAGPGVLGQNENADDWVCSQSGPVKDIHFWTSWMDDNEMEPPDPQTVPGVLDNVFVAIYDDLPAGSGGVQYSRPGTLLWSRAFQAGENEFTVAPAGVGLQGFYRPPGGPTDWTNPDHELYQQVNITKIEDPFVQTAGELYWLEVHANWETGIENRVGWTTSQNPFGSGAVWWNPEDQVQDWVPLMSPPDFTEPLALAFVITPEPATVGMLLLGSLILLQRRKGGQ